MENINYADMLGYIDIVINLFPEEARKLAYSKKYFLLYI